MGSGSHWLSALKHTVEALSLHFFLYGTQRASHTQMSAWLVSGEQGPAPLASGYCCCSSLLLLPTLPAQEVSSAA